MERTRLLPDDQVFLSDSEEYGYYNAHHMDFEFVITKLFTYNEITTQCLVTACDVPTKWSFFVQYIAPNVTNDAGVFGLYLDRHDHEKRKVTVSLEMEFYFRIRNDPEYNCCIQSRVDEFTVEPSEKKQSINFFQTSVPNVLLSRYFRTRIYVRLSVTNCCDSVCAVC
ncbi:hypothetical protein CDAR_416651 [Caerostris darwini]|uniref:Uncharacterized protein n=1 Tax=Caerostris darwini TaxID=1538125 RepID=A0AAV4MJS2_9ARAC|nr:hypothetical protein CDAR_416651 [Caerostris darwini]